MESVCHSMIVEYLLHNCFKNTAKAFLRETARVNFEQQKLIPSCIDNEKQWNLLDARKNLFDAVSQGDILSAFVIIKNYFPKVAAHELIPNGVLPTDDFEAIRLQNILFEMRCQQFIEIIRSPSSNVLEAIQYAQNYLKPINAKSKELIKEVTALIAYEDPYVSQSSHLLSQERRDKLAEQVNAIILDQCNLPKETSIEKISKQLSIVKEELGKHDKSRFSKEKPSL